MGIKSYDYDGIVYVTCSRCKITHAVDFEGNTLIPLHKAIKQSLKNAGWNFANMWCPECYQEIKNQKKQSLLIVDDIKQIEKEEYWDEFNMDSEENDTNQILDQMLSDLIDKGGD